MRITFKGVTRMVFLFETFVIKVPALHHGWSCFLRGLIGNISEGQTWRWNSGKYEKGKSHLLCPVIWSSWGRLDTDIREVIPFMKLMSIEIILQEMIKFATTVFIKSN